MVDYFGIRERVQYADVRDFIKKLVLTIGEENLGIKADGVGTNSNRSMMAMWIYLCRIPNLTVMLLGRWNQDTFVFYLRKKIHNFIKGLLE